MLISIEPGLYIPGLGGFRHSDTVLVSKDGYEPLTHFSSDLESMTLSGGRTLARLKGALVRKAVGI
jgi:Xaa-Pro dipeptidase